MNDIQFIDKIRAARPDKKDVTRAMDIINKYPCENTIYWFYNYTLPRSTQQARAVLANKQLNAIKDEDKFFRRVKAFLEKGIDVSFNNTIFSSQNTVMAKNYVEVAVQTAKENERIEKALAAI